MPVRTAYGQLRMDDPADRRPLARPSSQRSLVELRGSDGRQLRIPRSSSGSEKAEKRFTNNVRMESRKDVGCGGGNCRQWISAGRGVIDQQIQKMVITDELKPLFCQRVANTGIAQRAQLRLALQTVARHVFRIDMAWMTTQFGHAVADLRLQHPREALHTDLFQVCLPAPLAVKFRKVPRP